MNFNFKKFNKTKSHKTHYGKILIVRLPCNPIFPIGPIYLADHIHKCFPTIEQQFIDLARSVYITNDKRFEVKNEINKIFNSEYVEEKSYEDY